MLDAILFAIRGVSQALGIYLNIPVNFSDGVTVKVYEIVIFLFQLGLFIKILAMITKKQIHKSIR